MGKTAFSGPVYGAKGALWNPFTLVVSSGASTQVAATTRVPSYEDWYVTEALFQCSSCSTAALGALASSVAQFVFKANSSALHDNQTIVDTNSVTLVTITKDAGEYEGKRVTAGSTITLEAAAGSSALALGSLRAELRGYIRFISSTRAE
jgi:hypothetical protein